MSFWTPADSQPGSVPWSPLQANITKVYKKFWRLIGSPSFGWWTTKPLFSSLPFPEEETHSWLSCKFPAKELTQWIPVFHLLKQNLDDGCRYLKYKSGSSLMISEWIWSYLFIYPISLNFKALGGIPVQREASPLICYYTGFASLELFSQMWMEPFRCKINAGKHREIRVDR